MLKTTQMRNTVSVAAVITVLCLPLLNSLPVYADDTQTADTSEVSVYTIERNDPSPLDTLKQEVLEKYAEKSGDLKMEEINVDASSISTSTLDWTRTGLQPAAIQVSVVVQNEDGTKKTAAALCETEKAEINITASDAPQLVLKSDSVTIDLGSAFNYADNIGLVSSASNALPVLSETDNVDVNTEGTYDVKVTAVSARGTTAASYKVKVQKPAEVVRAEEEAAKKAAEEAAEKAAEEEAARQAEEQAAAQAAAETQAQTQTAAAAGSAVSGYTGGISASTGSAIADYALTLVGSPYVYGGTSPAGFDCSGFTQYVFAQFGISLPRTAEAQSACGTQVPASEAQPGDLVTYNGHAALCIGNGMIVNALNPSSGVAVCSMYSLYNGNMQVHRLG